MGYEATSLILEAPLPPVTGGVEVMIAEARLAFRPSYEGEPSTVENLLTVLVMIDPTDDARRSARAQAGHIAAATISFEQMPVGEDMGRWMSSLMADRPSSAASTVINLPGYSPAVATQVTSLITSMCIYSTDGQALVVAVAEVPLDWVDCQSIVDGFVEGGDTGREVTALKVFNLLSALIAPGQATALDAEDLRQVLGPALQPSTVIDAVWFPQDNVFTLGSDFGRTRLCNCSAVAVLPEGYASLRSMHRLIQAVRLSCDTEAIVVGMNPYGNRVEWAPSKSIVPVSLMVLL